MATTPMTPANWDALCNFVADRMKEHTRPFVTPLIENAIGRAPIVGTGTYLERAGVDLLTCEHVARNAPFLHQFDGHVPLLPLPATWRGDPSPIDAAVAPISSSHWSAVRHSARPLPMGRFARRYQPVEKEVFFFRGVADENVSVGAMHARVIMTGYCTQEDLQGGNADIFELHWNPQETTVTRGTSNEVRAMFKHDDPAGFSGSLVWNTRFVENGCDITTWKPEDAQITGLLQRWDTTTKTLLVWRVEHLLAWL